MKRNMSVVYRLICVRHGETDANKDMRIQGHIDTILSATGEAQAKQAGIALNSTRFSIAYSSDLKRARKTCELILKENSNPLEMIKTETRIRERNFGSIEGMLFYDVLEILKSSGSNWSNYNPPGAETLADVQKRIVEFFKELCQSVYDRSLNKGNIINDEDGKDLKSLDSSETILLVSHGASLKQLYLHFSKTLGCEGLKENDDINKISSNTGISEFLIKYSPRKYCLYCLRFNDDQHLLQVPN